MNITEVTFNGAKRTTTKRLYQYDYGQILQFTDLELPEEFEVDFAVDRCGNSETYVGENNQIQIPNKYLTTGNAVVGYIYLHTGEDDGETVYIFTVPVSPRPDRNDPVPSSEQKSRIDVLIERMNEAVDEASQSERNAAASAVEAQSWTEGAEVSAISAETRASEASQSASDAQRYADEAKETAKSLKVPEITVVGETLTINKEA